MRWLMIWKLFDEPQDIFKESKPGVIRADGLSKVKTRIVLIGYKYPDLTKCDEWIGKSCLPISSPILNRMGRNTLLEATEFDRHILVYADIHSTFLQIN